MTVIEKAEIYEPSQLRSLWWLAFWLGATVGGVIGGLLGMAYGFLRCKGLM